MGILYLYYISHLTGNQEVVMFNRIIFSKRIKQLRKCYKFTIIDFSTCFKIVSKTSVGAWEKATAIPSADVLADLSSFFGISMDWFAGFSNIPYTNESIENAENFVLKKLIEIDRDTTYKSFYPNEYLNAETRKELYSLPVRANIVVLSHCGYIPFKEDELNYKPKAISKFENAVKYKANLIINHLYPTVQVTSNHKNILYIGDLDQLLKREITTPIYDIESSDLK